MISARVDLIAGVKIPLNPFAENFDARPNCLDEIRFDAYQRSSFHSFSVFLLSLRTRFIGISNINHSNQRQIVQFRSRDVNKNLFIMKQL